MKKALALVFCLAPMAFALPSGGDMTAEKVVEGVSRTYSSLRSFRFVEDREERVPSVLTFLRARTPSQGGILPEPVSSNLMPPVPYETDLAEFVPGRVRLDILGIGGGLVVSVASNGETMWAYLPLLHEFLQAAAVPLLQEMWTSPPYYGGDDILQYSRLALEGKRATLRGEETLSLGEQKVPCYVIDMQIPVGSRRLWVDEQRFIVLQDEWTSPPASGPDPAAPNRSYFAYAGVWTSRLTKADLGSIPDETFEFVPPTGTRRVASFTSPNSPLRGDEKGRAHQLAEGFVERLAYRLMGADVLENMKAKKAPDFAAEGVDGRTLRLKDLRGKAVVLDFYATWCKPCQQDLAAIQKLYTDLRGRNVVFLGIDECEDRETVKNFLKKSGYTFPAFLDSDHTLPTFYRTGWVPTVVVINRKGKIAARYVGAGGEEQLRRALKSAGLNSTP